jgi:hypothetical protein
MRPKKHETTKEGDLFRARLDQIINMKHELVRLGGKIDWAWIDGQIAPLYSNKGRPGIEESVSLAVCERSMAGCHQRSVVGKRSAKKMVNCA